MSFDQITIIAINNSQEVLNSRESLGGKSTYEFSGFFYHDPGEVFKLAEFSGNKGFKL